MIRSISSTRCRLRSTTVPVPLAQKKDGAKGNLCVHAGTVHRQRA